MAPDTGKVARVTNTIVFLHGAWVTPACWDEFRGFFEGQGYRCQAPAWPGRDRPIEALRAHPSDDLGRLGIAEIVDHYAAIIRAMDPAPVLVGHSFGGLFVQLLLDRGLGAAGVAIDSAPPRGVLPLQPSVIRSNAGVLLTWQGWRRVVRQTFGQFRYAFVNALTPIQQRQAYDRHVVPETGRIFFQAALSALDPKSPARIDFTNNRRVPLLMIAGRQDHIVPAAMNRANYRCYARSGALTHYKEFDGRCHWIIAQPGWQEVAEYVRGWLGSVLGGTA
jgi:pimeloyl-ACP methyl ester carboxylesterase